VKQKEPKESHMGFGFVFIGATFVLECASLRSKPFNFLEGAENDEVAHSNLELFTLL
jgi:hypothetical protein